MAPNRPSPCEIARRSRPKVTSVSGRAGKFRRRANIHPFKISHNVQALIVTAAAQQVNGGGFSLRIPSNDWSAGSVSGVLGDELAGEGMGEKGGRSWSTRPRTSANRGSSRSASAKQHLHSPHALLLLGDARALESTARWRRPRTAAIVVRSTGRAMAGKFLNSPSPTRCGRRSSITSGARRTSRRSPTAIRLRTKSCSSFPRATASTWQRSRRPVGLTSSIAAALQAFCTP